MDEMLAPATSTADGRTRGSSSMAERVETTVSQQHDTCTMRVGSGIVLYRKVFLGLGLHSTVSTVLCNVLFHAAHQSIATQIATSTPEFRHRYDHTPRTHGDGTLREQSHCAHFPHALGAWLAGV